MAHQRSNFELDLLFIAASLKHIEDYKEEHWHKLEEQLNRIENGFNKELKSGQPEQNRCLGIFKLKCKLFKK